MTRFRFIRISERDRAGIFAPTQKTAQWAAASWDIDDNGV